MYQAGPSRLHEVFPSGRFAIALRAPRLSRLLPVLCRGTRCAGAPPFERLPPLYPRGPRSSPGYSVPHHHHLISPMRPLAGTSRFHRLGLYEMPSLCATPQRLGDPRVVPCFRWLFSVGMSPSETPGSRPVAYTQFLHRPRWPSTFWDGLGTSFTLYPPILVEESISGLNYGSLALQPADLLAPLSEQTTLSPSLRGLLHPGFRRIGHPHRRRTSLQWQLGKFHWRDSPIYTR